jgi:pimeloyl-ACP methyl ester carboxylesterase
VTGSGPLVVLSHGIGDRRHAYRFLAPMLAQAGYRVASAELRGQGESSIGWASITRTDIAGDLLALTARLGGPAVVAGHSISGGAATIAAATLVMALALVWLAHIGLDRLLGTGLKYNDRFSRTHLGDRPDARPPGRDRQTAPSDRGA